MPPITLVDANDLLRWASTRRAQELIPALVRRLIQATTTTASHIGLPAGEAIQQGGYDGVVVIDETHQSVPNGMSIWEFGASANPKSKADEDYDKRKAKQPDSAIGPVDPKSTTFVFVTPRRWTAKTKWLKERRAEAFWRDVRVLDADDLESWLSQAPATHVWLSVLLGRRPTGADDLEAMWRDWSESTSPALSAGLMFAGREEARKTICAWFTLSSSEPTLGVESESRDETIALVGAALQTLPENQRSTALSRTVVVRDADAFSQVAAMDQQLFLVTAFSPGDLTQRATRHGHRVLIPVDPGESVVGTLKVPRVHREAAYAKLREMGFPDDRARALAGLARRSLLVLRRRLATSPAVSRPPWTSPTVGPSVLPVFLLGAVHGDVQGDVEALSRLGRESAEVAIEGLARLAAMVDPPLRRVGSVWYLISQEDAWEGLSAYFTRDLLERFETIAEAVLGSPDPAYELPPESRWVAGLHGKWRSHSDLLSHGVADTLALLGARGATHLVAPGLSAADFAERTVRHLFEDAGRDWKRWASLAPAFPLLMEAAPDAMLAAIDAGLSGPEPSPVIGLFGHDIGGVFSSSPHTHLLWALELAAWSPDYLGRTALILAELARRAPRGELGNLPSESLRSIFLSWMPATSAAVEARLAVLDTLRKREPIGAWDLMAALLPERDPCSMAKSRPRWREWAPEGDTCVTDTDLLDSHCVEVVTRMLDDSGESGARWATLVAALQDVPLDVHEAILERLSTLRQELLTPHERSVIWRALCEVVSKHRSFAEAWWALSPERVNAIAGVADGFEPADIVDRESHLFSRWPVLPEGLAQDFKAHDRLLEARRIEAARAWYAVLGFERLVRLSATLECPDALGDALAASGIVPLGEESDLVKLALGAPESGARMLGRSYLARRFPRGGESIPMFLQEHGRDWPATTRAEALLAMPPGAESWDVAETLGGEECAHYWRHVLVHRVEVADVPRAVRELSMHSRPHAAAQVMARQVQQGGSPSAEEVRNVILAAASNAHDITGYRIENARISELISFLEREAEAGLISGEEVARLELVTLPILRQERPPRRLHIEMERSPSLFVEALCQAYAEDGDRERVLADPERVLARLARQLLRSWRTPPGLENGMIDAERLGAWVDDARRCLAEANRTAIGDLVIGQVLSGAPPGADAVWPAEPIREVVERLGSERLEDGLRLGRLQQRGVVSRELLSGGDKERSLKVHYEADAGKLSGRWPRTAAFLRSLAAFYESEAAREDIEAELRHDLEA